MLKLDRHGNYYENKKILFGLGSIDLYIEDRYLSKKDEENFGSKYKVFMIIRFFWIKIHYTFRVSSIGYFE